MPCSTGYHRSLCMFSHHYRGTAEKPGLVLALDHGGACTGKAFAVEPAAWEGVLSYLRKREQIGYVYIEKTVDVCLQDTGEVAQALTYVVDANHSQYAGKLTLEETLHYVRQGVGLAGSCADYVKNTVAHLREFQVQDDYLEQVVTALD